MYFNSDQCTCQLQGGKKPRGQKCNEPTMIEAEMFAKNPHNSLNLSCCMTLKPLRFDGILFVSS